MPIIDQKRRRSRTVRSAVGLTLIAAITWRLLIATMPAQSLAGTLTLTFYDASGAAMTGQAARDLASNKTDNRRNGYASKIVAAIVNPTTLEDLNTSNTPITPTVNRADLAFALSTPVAPNGQVVHHSIQDRAAEAVLRASLRVTTKNAY